MRLQTTYNVVNGLTFHVLILPNKEMRVLGIDVKDFGLLANRPKISDKLLVLYNIAKKVEALNDMKGTNINDEGN